METRSMAENAESLSYEYGRYLRLQDKELKELGGVLTWSSNDGERDISFSPTERWEFEDGSVLEVGYSHSQVLK